MPTPREELDTIITTGIWNDLYYCEEALFLMEGIGKNSDSINKKSFGQFFGVLQRILTNEIYLSITRLYEKKTRYPLKSIPAALSILKENANCLSIEQPIRLERKLNKLGLSVDKIDPTNNSEITNAIYLFFTNSLPEKETHHALNALKTIRDKAIGHRENIDINTLPTTTWVEIHELIEFAKNFLNIIAEGYLGISTVSDDDRSFVSDDAKKANNCLRRLLEKAGVIESQNKN